MNFSFEIDRIYDFSLSNYKILKLIDDFKHGNLERIIFAIKSFNELKKSSNYFNSKTNLEKMISLTNILYKYIENTDDTNGESDKKEK